MSRLQRSRLGRVVAVGLTSALVSVGAIAVSAPVAQGATTLTPSTTADDGSSESLRYLLELTAVDGDTIQLEAGAVYVLDRCAGGTEVEPAVSLGEGDIRISAAVIIQGNGATIRQTCEGQRVLYTEDNLSLVNVTITGGTAIGGGGGVRIDGEGEPAFFLVGSSIVGNCSTGSGGGIKMNADGNVIIANSTIARNAADDNGGGLSHSHDGDVAIQNSTITENTAAIVGGVEVRDGDLTLVYTDVVNNSLSTGTDCGVVSGDVGDDAEDASLEPAAVVYPVNIVVNGEGSVLRSFGSVVAVHPGGVNCGVESTTSSGYNFADDQTCGFVDPTDKQSGAPGLGSLASNGGPTQTLLPQNDSPLVDAIPNSACGGVIALAQGAVPTDQRNLVRPSPTGGACDIGAVEVQTQPVVVEPTFTG